MTATELLTSLISQGFNLIPLPDGKLEVKPASKLTEELREELRRRKAEILALLRTQQQPSTPDLRTLYAEMAETVRDDCFLIDPCWLVDCHSELWQQLVTLDDELSRLEQQDAGEQRYQRVLARLVACLREARMLYEKEREGYAETRMQ